MHRLLVLLAVVALLGGACSGSDDDASVDDASVDAAATDDAGSSSEPAPESDPETDTEPEPEPTTEPVPDPEQDVPSFDFSAVDPLIETFVEDNGLNGAALVMVHRDFGIVDERFWGSSMRTGFALASNSRWWPPVLLALDDAGQLDIGAPIADVLPFASDHPMKLRNCSPAVLDSGPHDGGVSRLPVRVLSHGHPAGLCRAHPHHAG